MMRAALIRHWSEAIHELPVPGRCSIPPMPIEEEFHLVHRLESALVALSRLSVSRKLWRLLSFFLIFYAVILMGVINVLGHKLTKPAPPQFRTEPEIQFFQLPAPTLRVPDPPVSKDNANWTHV